MRDWHRTPLRTGENGGRLNAAERRNKVTSNSPYRITSQNSLTQVGVSLRTLGRFSKAEAYPERKARTRSLNALTAYLPFIEEQWRAGRRCAARLHRQIQEQGFLGSYGAVQGVISLLRKGMALYPREVSIAPERIVKWRDNPLKKNDRIVSPKVRENPKIYNYLAFTRGVSFLR